MQLNILKSQLLAWDTLGKGVANSFCTRLEQRPMKKKVCDSVHNYMYAQ